MRKQLMPDIYCDSVQGDFTEKVCGVDTGRISALGLSLVPLVDPEDDSEWTDGQSTSPQTHYWITTGVRGGMPRAQDAEVDGFGLESTLVVGADHQVDIEILGVTEDGNVDWANTVLGKRWYVALPFGDGGTKMYYVSAPAIVSLRPQTETDIRGLTRFVGTIKWTDIYSPLVYDTPASLIPDTVQG